MSSLPKKYQFSSSNLSISNGLQSSHYSNKSAISLNSVFNERAGPRAGSNWFWKSPAASPVALSPPMPSFSATPDYAHVSQLYPNKLITQSNNMYRYQPTASSANSSRITTNAMITDYVTEATVSSPIIGQASPSFSANVRSEDPETELDTLTQLLIQGMSGNKNNNNCSATLINVKAVDKSVNKKSSNTINIRPANSTEETTAIVDEPVANKKKVLLQMCFRCQKAINPDDCNIRLSTLNAQFHSDCFTCYKCEIPLTEKVYFHSCSDLLCEQCMQASLAMCVTCGQAIAQRVLRALGKSYHPQCFKCFVCGIVLDGLEFTVDVHNKIYCLTHFNERYAPRCAFCKEPIVTAKMDSESRRIISGDLNYHLNCYNVQCSIGSN